MNGLIQYEKQTFELGIEVELSPSNIYEIHGSAERAGQEAIIKGIKMLSGANLSNFFWLEAALISIYLYNKSFSEVYKQKLFVQVLDEQFRNYFRQYDFQQVKALTTDLRPDWNRIFRYSYRAYLLIKEREAKLERKLYKVQLRGYIRYLVGYITSNIYRIQILQLYKVIITRNITFDESIIYSLAGDKIDI